jgi:hypothetical protein
MPPIADSTIICPLVGTSVGDLTNNLTNIIINKETTQLVTIELVTGNEPMWVNSEDMRLTPPSAENALDVTPSMEKIGRMYFKSL